MRQQLKHFWRLTSKSDGCYLVLEELLARITHNFKGIFSCYSHALRKVVQIIQTWRKRAITWYGGTKEGHVNSRKKNRGKVYFDNKVVESRSQTTQFDPRSLSVAYIVMCCTFIFVMASAVKMCYIGQKTLQNFSWVKKDVMTFFRATLHSPPTKSFDRLFLSHSVTLLDCWCCVYSKTLDYYC